MTASVTAAAVIGSLNTNNSKTKPFSNVEESVTTSKTCSKSSSSSTTSTIKHLSLNLNENSNLIRVNPFLTDFFDCIENLPNKLQILLTELRSVDAQVNARHRKLQLLKQAIFSKISAENTTNEETIINEDATKLFDSFTIEQLLNKLHQILVQCQIFGDQKVKLTSQIMDTLSTKTRQLGFESKTYDERNFQIELNEESIINEFKMSIKKRSMYHHYNCSSSGARGTGSRNNNSSFNNQQLTSRSKHNFNSVDVNRCNKTNNNKACFSSARNNQTDAYSFDENQQWIYSNTNYSHNENHLHTNNINNSLRNLNNIKNKNNLRHKTSVGNSFSIKNVIKNKIVLNNNKHHSSSKKPRIETDSLSSSSNNSPFLSSQLASFKHIESTDDNSNQTGNNRPKRQLNNQSNDGKTLSEVGMNKKRRLNQLKSSAGSLSLTGNHDLNQCKSPSSISSYSSNNSKNHKRLNGNSNNLINLKNDNKKIKKKLSTSGSKHIIKKRLSNIINDEQQRTTPDKKKKDSIHKKSIHRNNRNTDNKEIDSEEYENYDINDDDHKNKISNHVLLPYDENDIKNADQLDDLAERNSNETESINHIDNEDDDDDMDDLNSDDQLDEDNNDSLHFNEDAESVIGDDEHEDDEENDQDDKNVDDDDNDLDDYDEGDDDHEEDEDGSDSDYRNVKRKSIYNENSNENDLNENSENQSWAFNQANKSKSNRNKTLNSATNSTNTTSNTNNNNNNTVNEDEQTYCTCEQVSYGQMICCDNKACKIEWFHFNCVKLTNKPKGKWYCPNCRGETHKVMKKNINKNHLSSSSNYSNYNNNNSGYHSTYAHRAK